MKRLVMIENVPGQDKGGPLGLYVHVPFCASTCDFCAFYQKVPEKSEINTYLDGIRREISLIDWDRPVTTIFWGGGTPGLLTPDALTKLGQLVLSVCPRPPVEWTVELAPGSVTAERLAALKSFGVTRVSLGVQSFQPGLLDALGRRHNLEQIDRAFDLIRTADFPSVNLDLMFALPGQSKEDWMADLEEAVKRKPDHLSTYCLTFEEDTALWVKLSQGKVKLDVEKEAIFYEETWAYLESVGFPQYEVSNFSRPGFECRHNVNTWQMNSWVGLGPSGASQFGGWRGANVSDLNLWLARLDEGRRATEDRVALTPALLAADSVVFGLRMNEGVDLARLGSRFPNFAWKNFETLFQQLAQDGLLHGSPGGVIKLTSKGRLLADAIGTEILSACEETVSR